MVNLNACGNFSLTEDFLKSPPSEEINLLPLKKDNPSHLALH